MGPFNINVENKEYCVTPLEEPDQILYEIKNGDDLVCVIGLNEGAEWEPTTDVEYYLVKQLGAAIEDHEA